MTGTNIEVRPDDRAVGWRLAADSATGGKVYSVTVVGRSVVIGWGRESVAGRYGAGSQVNVLQYPSHAVAIATAQQKTLHKERKGYRLQIEPKVLVFNDLPVPWVGPAEGLVSRVLRYGTKL